MRLIMQAYKKFSFFLAFLLVTACQSEPSLQQIQGDALGTSYSILYLDNQPNASLVDAVDAVFLQMNQSMSTYWPNSLISKINRGEVVKIDTDFERVFNAANKVWTQTGGFFDPTVGALVNAYGFGPDKALSGITSKKLDSIMRFTGFDKLQLLDESIIKSDPRVYLDFNAIGKGYAVDELAMAVENLGYTDFLIEVGGEIYAKGIHPIKKAPWRVAIDHPEQNTERKFIATLPLTNKGLASSGNYRKFRTDANGNKYVHTINPKTGKSVKSKVLSSSVLAPTTMYADAYATALMAMPFEQGKALIESLAEVEALWVLAEKDSVRVVATKGFIFDRQ
jgi:thiamine biosynthesis lipoprotein